VQSADRKNTENCLKGRTFNEKQQGKKMKKMNKRKVGIIATLGITSLILLIYIALKNDIFDFSMCSCTARYFPMAISIMIGYALMIVSTLLFIASIWRIKKLSRWWIIPALIVLGVALYGNGYRLYYCPHTPAIYKFNYFTNHTTLGYFVEKWNFEVDSLKTGKYNGKILGYSVDRQRLILYRIGNKPLEVKTSFLFWKIRPNIFVHDLSPKSHSFRNLEFEENNIGYEFIGGQDMPLEVFLREIYVEKNEFALEELKNKQIINEADGTTRFRFEIE